MEQSIELDCAPGMVRPGQLIKGVIFETGLPEREPVAKTFGNWKWRYDDIAPEVWAEIQPTLKARITELYHGGSIRYGSW